MDYTLLMQLPVRELLDRARMASGLTTAAHNLMRALADTLDDRDAAATDLEEQLDAAATDLEEQIDALTLELRDAERRADAWRDEAQALDRQLAMARG